MMDLKGLNCHTGIVTSTGDRVTVEFKANQKLNTCFLNTTTQFLGPIDDKLALKSVWPGLSVNVWVADKSCGCTGKKTDIVPYASVNWR